jgi:hypothetical protein
MTSAQPVVVISDIRKGRKVYSPSRRYAAFKWLEFTADDGGDYLARVRLEYEDGHYVLARFCVDRRPEGRPITADIMRRIPVSGLAFNPALADHCIEADSELLATVPAFQGVGLTQMKAQGLSPDNVRLLVAMVYEGASLQNQNAAEAVAEYFQCSKSTAGKLIAEAKVRELITSDARRTRF